MACDIDDREGNSPSPKEPRLGRMFQSSATGRRRGANLPDQSRSCQVLHETPVSSAPDGPKGWCRGRRSNPHGVFTPEDLAREPARAVQRRLTREYDASGVGGKLRRDEEIVIAAWCRSVRLGT